MTCPCYSTVPYEKCCKPYHDGKRAPDALKLMRSRYSAYALGLADYIIQTTHPSNSQFPLNRESILSFCRETQFIGLTIHEHTEELTTATVTFTAHLIQQNQKISFTEKSTFVKEHDKWLYQNGLMFSKEDAAKLFFPNNKG